MFPPVLHRAGPDGMSAVFPGPSPGSTALRRPRSRVDKRRAGGLDGGLALARRVPVLPVDSRGEYAAAGAGTTEAGAEVCTSCCAFSTRVRVVGTWRSSGRSGTTPATTGTPLRAGRWHRRAHRRLQPTGGPRRELTPARRARTRRRSMRRHRCRAWRRTGCLRSSS